MSIIKLVFNIAHVLLFCEAPQKGRLWVRLDERWGSQQESSISQLSTLTGHEFVYCSTVSQCTNWVFLGWHKTEEAF